MKNNASDLISKVKEIYENGGNIIKYLKDKKNASFNTVEDILISYDFQSGSYIKFVEENPKYIQDYSKAIANTLKKLGNTTSILEAGVGEATTFANVILEFNGDKRDYFGFDISWSRINFGLKYLKSKEIHANLFVGDLFNIPLSSSSIDIVYTSHSIEPNGGREKEAIKELYRVCKNYLVLLEPTNEFATIEGKNRMNANGYVQNLKSVIENLNYNHIGNLTFVLTN